MMARRPAPHTPMFRWRIALLACVAIAISYLDRQALPVAIQAVGRDIPVSNEQFSLLQSAFLFAYALMYVGGGWLVDRIGTYLGFALMMLLWSLACAGHAFAGSVGTLVACRLLLGLGEGGGFPAATRAIAESFVPEERSTAMGLVNAGSAIGMMLAPPLIAGVLAVTDWRWIFLLTGALGLAWTLGWLRSERRRWPSNRSQALPTEDDATPPRWIDLVRDPQVRGVVAAKFLSDAAWYFFLFWLPKYLYDARGFDVKTIGTFAWIPPAAAGIGCVVGGSFSSWLLVRTGSIGLARTLALGASAVLMPFILFVPHVPIAWVVVLFSLAYFGQQSWSTLIMTLPADLFQRRVVGTVAGLVGFGGAMGGVAFGELVGYLLDHGVGYGVVFAIAGSLHLVAFGVIAVTMARRHAARSSARPKMELEYAV